MFFKNIKQENRNTLKTMIKLVKKKKKDFDLKKLLFYLNGLNRQTSVGQCIYETK